MEEKIKVLEVNNIDLPGRRFNGYDLIDYSFKKDIDIIQAVIYKQSQNNKVHRLLKDSEQMQTLEDME